MSHESPEPSAADVASDLEPESSGKRRGALGRWLELERALWSLALLGWRKQAPRPDDSMFTHHKQANWTMIAGVLSALVVVEGTVVHLWLQGAGYVLATWAALGLHVYLLAWIMGDAQAIRLYATRVSVQPDGVRVVALRVGLRGSAIIPLAHIAEVTTGTWDEALKDGELVSVSGFANVSFTFDRPIAFEPMLGKRRQITSLRVQVDDPERFLRAIDRSTPRP